MHRNGYYCYSGFFLEDPLMVLEWSDSETDAKAWLVINSLKNGAAGGGTRMRKGGTRDEAIFLAKTMEIKFRVSGPSIGGAKSVISFDPRDPRKLGVLERWFRTIEPLLRTCYGTGGDMNLDDKTEIMPTLQKIGISDPQFGILAGHVARSANRLPEDLARQMQDGVQTPVGIDGINQTLEGNQLEILDWATGYGVAQSIVHYYRHIRGGSLHGKRVIVEGFGNVGGAAAYFLQKLGAKVVGIIIEEATEGEKPLRYIRSISNGLDITRLLRHRVGKKFLPNTIPSEYEQGYQDYDDEEFWKTNADIFVPAAASGLLSDNRLEQLKTNGITLIAPGANNPFKLDWKLDHKAMAEQSIRIQRRADQMFSVLPDYVVNCGTACVFRFFMYNANAGLNGDHVFEDIDLRVGNAVDKLFGQSNSIVAPSEACGLLNRAYWDHLQPEELSQ